MSEFGDESFHKIKNSAIFLSIYTNGMHKDHACALQLGYAILLNKPIYFVQMPGSEIPENLRKIASGMVLALTDDKKGIEKATEELLRMIKDRYEPEEKHQQ